MTHLTLLVNTNVHNDISVDHIKILTKNREEITLRFIDNDHHKKSKVSNLGPSKKYEAYFYYVLFNDEEVDDGSISDFEKMDALQDATILEVQIHIDNFEDKLEKIKFTLETLDFVFEEDDFMDSYYKSYTLPIVYHENYSLSINNDKE